MARWASLLGALCLLGGACAAVGLAMAPPARSSRHRPSHTARRCRRTARHHCPARSRKRSAHVRPSVGTPTPKSASGSSGSGSGSGSGGSASLAGGTAPTSTPTNPGGATAGQGGDTTPAEPGAGGPARVQVTAQDTGAFSFVLSRPTVPAGKVIMEFVNRGQDEHNLNADDPTESLAGTIPNTAPGAHPTMTLILHPGSYTLFCSLPGHEARGMKATLVVE
jgi:plastocyanin